MPQKPITVGTTSTRLSDRNLRRTALSFANEGSVAVFISQDEQNILANGFPIDAGGAADLIRALGDEAEDQWFAVVSAGTANVRISEQYGLLPAMFRPNFQGGFDLVGG